MRRCARAPISRDWYSHPKSPRNLDAGQAAALAARMRGRTQARGAASPMPATTEIAGAVNAAQPDFLQLHGSETPERVAAIRARFGVAVIKAIAVAEPSRSRIRCALRRRRRHAAVRRQSRRQAPHAPGGHRRGVRLAVAPWTEILAALAAGRRAERGAMSRARSASSGAPGVDVSSGVETAPGREERGADRAISSRPRAAPLSREARA